MVRIAALCLLLAGGASAALSPSAVLLRSDAARPVSMPRFPRDDERPQAPGEDRTRAPYLAPVGAGEGERIPLKETSARVDISGVIARVKVRQVFENTGKAPIEAVYVFPTSTRAAVHGMRMKIGERTLEAKIEKRDVARQQYEAAKQTGQRASLLEQQRPNVFTMQVANLMPGARIEVELEYSELLLPEDGTYEFVYPTVVGPRYAGGTDPSKDGWVANPYLPEGQPAAHAFAIQVHVETGIALKELASPSHKVAVKYSGPARADVSLDQQGGANKDFVLRYRLAGDRIETGLLLFPGATENFFAFLMEPPRRPTAAQLTPREYIFVLDVSGSMHGFPLDTAKALMRNLLGQLKPSDTFNIVLFAGSAWVLSPEASRPATPDNIQKAIALIDQSSGGGGTELLGALQRAYGIPKRERGVSRSVVVVTDGYVGVEASTYKYIRERLNESNLFAFGIGSSVNRGLIEGMARAGQGEPFVVLNPGAATEEARKLARYISQPVLSGIDVRFHGFDAYEVAPAKLPDLMAQRPVLVFGKYRGKPTGGIELTGFTASGKYSQRLEVASASVSASHEPLKWLWARKWVEILEDQHSMTGASEVVDAITDLGMTYRLMTPFTSFLAVDSEIVNHGGRQVNVIQPLPLPEGVSERALGRNALSARGAGSGAMFGASAEAGLAAPRRDAPAPAAVFPYDSAGGILGGQGVRKEQAKAATAARVSVLSPTGKGLAALLLRQVQNAVAAGCGTAGDGRLTVFVDGAGKISRFLLAGFSPDMTACLQAQLAPLVGQASGTQGGEWVLRLQLTR